MVLFEIGVEFETVGIEGQVMVDKHA